LVATITGNRSILDCLRNSSLWAGPRCENKSFPRSIERHRFWRDFGQATFKQVLDALKRQVLVGKSYLGVAKGLLNADPVLLDGARTFFGLTIDGSLELAQLAAARLYEHDRTRPRKNGVSLYDTTGKTVTVRILLLLAAKEISLFQRGDYGQVRDAIVRSMHRVISLQPILNSIRERRNKWLAHLDPETVSDSATLAERTKLTIPDLDRTFKETEEIVLEMSSLYEGVIGELHYLGDDDYKSALNWIRRAKCTFIENYEKEFGPWTGLRPKDCSRKPYDPL
jgi:AbiU2